MKIEKPGFYKTKNGHKAEVLKVINGGTNHPPLAFGILWLGENHKAPKSHQWWVDSGRSGIMVSYEHERIISEWREPVTIEHVTDRLFVNGPIERGCARIEQRMKELLPKKGERVRITVEELEESEDEYE